MSFAPILFSTDPSEIREAVPSGIAGVIVDWENKGKGERQASADTQINYATVDDLERVRACTRAPVICRINETGAHTPLEIEAAIAAGASEVLLPMVRSPREVAEALRLARDRCGVGILVETCAAVAAAGELGRLPLSRVYVGLNDLAIDGGIRNIFWPVLGDTVERVRRHFRVPFGFAGLTVIDEGAPISCRLLIAEMARLDCQFSFLRRSYHRDIQGRSPRVEIPRMIEAVERARRRNAEQVWSDRLELEQAIRGWPEPERLPEEQRFAAGIR